MKAPENLKTRTRMAAQEMREGVGQAQRQPQRGRMKRLAAVACAMAIFVGGATVWSRRAPDSGAVGAISNTFGLVAYAADTGEIIQPQDSKIVFDVGAGGADSPESGFFSGCLFKVTGDNIEKVSASIDRGGLYRSSREYIEESEVQAILQGTSPLTADADDIMVMSEPEKNKWWVDISQRMENGFTEAYDPDTSYGLWDEPQPVDMAQEDDLADAWQARIDEFDGAKLTVTVTFTDGTTDSQTMTLHTGKLAVEYNGAGGAPQYTGEVLTDAQAENQSYLYGVYAEIA